MRILIAGANGQIGRKLIRAIANSPHHSRAMIRQADQADTLRELGADQTVVADLEGDLSGALPDCDAVIFTAGSGGHTGPEKTDAVDRDGAIAMIDAANKAGVRRFVMVSSMGAQAPENGPEKLRHYLQAKHAADMHLVESGLDYTIVRPGRLTDEPASGKVALAASLGRSGEVSRADVAAVLVALLDAPHSQGRSCEVLTGDVPIAEAVGKL